ncbi:hypothetical protein CN03_03000 [Thalassolituus oleivorans]|jgi:5-methylcytosine-specific restriction protein B|uniref:AAA family ATPase n=1 Tax=Thalassolituus oleivorans TaxID=187493 RepID=UPI0009494041|nr:AAA family ATPase [Thalassolituus oleivorans]APR65983.1 hypothetical protein CN03_03000 [Thalassolituus oleivorans]
MESVIGTTEGKMLLSKVIEIARSDQKYIQRSGDDAALQRFYSKFPLTSLASMSIDDYALGGGRESESFCWWLEFGLKNSLGRYAPGNAKGHVIYRKPDGSIYKVNALSELKDSEAMQNVARLHSFFANYDVDHEKLESLDNDLISRVETRLPSNYSLSPARKLRMVALYNPDKIIPIYATKHYEYFLNTFGINEKIPVQQQIFARHNLLYRVFEEIKEQVPELTPYGFMMVLYSDDLALNPKDYGWFGEVEMDDIWDENIYEPDAILGLNTILYGPPGTGKTFATTALAVKMADPDYYLELYNELAWPDFFQGCKERYDELVKEGRVLFTTFHQSFSYEDFIEGIRAETKDGQLSYNIEDGVFKALALLASAQKSTSGIIDTLSLDGRQIWKMSLGDTSKSETQAYEDCIEQNYIGLGWGDNIDFSQCHDRSAVQKLYSEHTSKQYNSNSYCVTAVNFLKNVIKNGDIVIVSDGNKKFRAIAEVTGDYAYADDTKERYYNQCRPVRWLRIFDTSIPKEALFNKSLSQMTLYELKPSTIKIEKLKDFLSAPEERSSVSDNYVLIIDEINRGNISRIFGELITLLEPDKRKGGADERSVTLPYSKESFSVPDNLYVLGTMNTADKSLAQLDLALRRRFEFLELMPEPELLDGIIVHGVDIAELLDVMNQRIEVLLDRDHMIGHAYFLPLKTEESEEEREFLLADIFAKRIIPLLQEYFFADWERIGWVLNDPAKNPESQFIQHVAIGRSLPELFPESVINEIRDRRYRINKNAFAEPEAYQGVLAAPGKSA